MVKGDQRALAIAGTAAVLVVGVVFATAASGQVADACHRDAAEAPCLQVTLPNGTTVRHVIPNFGVAPELDAVEAPVTVVIFEGPHRAVPVLPALQPSTTSAGSSVVNGVLCVRVPLGEELYYADVDLTGMDLSRIAVDRRDP
jgi:hypothetical protein